MASIRSLLGYYGCRPTVFEMDDATFLEECQLLVQAAIQNVSLIFSPVVTVAAVRELTGESAPSDWVGFPFNLNASYWHEADGAKTVALSTECLYNYYIDCVLNMPCLNSICKSYKGFKIFTCR